MMLVPQGHCTACGGIALLSCQCNGVLSGALVLYLVHRFIAMKPLTPLWHGLRAWVKPPSPLLARNLCFCGIVGEQRRWRFHLGAREFAPRPCVIAKARKSSPRALKTPQIRRFCACWANFFADLLLEGPCWARFFAPTGAAPRSCWRRAPRLEPRDRLDSGGL